MIKAGIIGATGYTGAELLRLLLPHPDVEVVAISSRANKGQCVSDHYPALEGQTDLRFSDSDDAVYATLDVLFFATPHGVAQRAVTPYLNSDVKIIDLSADFRIKDQALWEQWYGMPHGNPEQLANAVYGIPELWRQQISSARLVACAGCYPTSIQLALAPLMEQGVVKPESIIASSGSGISGAGRSAKVPFLFTEASESFKAYGTAGHRHQPEIEQGLRALQTSDQTPATLLFLPHLVPMIRGIHSTVIADLQADISEESLHALFDERYAAEPFVTVLPLGSQPDTKSIRGTNGCRLSVFRRDGRVVVLSVIDNLTKGASGQAIQCMNLMFGMDETLGLTSSALAP